MLFFIVLFLAAFAVHGTHMNDLAKEKTLDHKNKYTNHLINESSPYLLMHAHNPVDWYPWGEEALNKAKKENKLLIISIGYAACHWCHVMEEESFSDIEVADVMNRNFVCIKVDREERPDIDQVYMDAAHILTGSGGWPLNAVALPDGRPVFAATYFPRDRWVSILEQIHNVYQKEPDKVVQQSQSITEGIQATGAVQLNPAKPDFDPNFPDLIVENWQHQFDLQWGGERRAPKFPLPIGYRYLMNYYYLTRHNSNLERPQGDKAFLSLGVTLERMAMGGIYDQAGGGFARYSTDMQWNVPHFEKMLYDNAQLTSLYSYAYQLTENPLYKQVVYETLEFVERELTSPETTKGGRGFYSSLDADSEGEEGKFYVWTEKEFRDVLGEDAALMAEYYDITAAGNWENGSNILFRQIPDREFADAHNISMEALRETVIGANKKLLIARSRRERPALDDKILTAWNGLMLTAYVDAYRVFGDPAILKRALENAQFIVAHMMADDGRLNRNYKDGKSSINAFLDDYSFVIQAFISLYQANFDEQWLFRADKLLKYTLAHFYDEKTCMFFYTSDLDPELIARKMEVSDNVIPSSNSQMALNLYMLGSYFYNEDYTKKSLTMLNNVKDDLGRHGPYFANWGLLLIYFTYPLAEVAIIGDDVQARRKELDRHFLPLMLMMGGKTEGKLPLLKGKLIKNQTTFYVCRNKTCKTPVTETADALKQLK